MKLDKIPLDSLKGVGSKMLEKLARLGLATVQDLLFHLPLRYEDRTQVWPIGDLPPGLHGAVEGEIQDTQLVMGRRRMLVCRIGDGTGSLTLRFFNFTAAQKNSLAQGRLIRCFGEARPGKYGLEMAHPEYKLLGAEQAVLSATMTSAVVKPYWIRAALKYSCSVSPSQTMSVTERGGLLPGFLRNDAVPRKCDSGWRFVIGQNQSHR